MGRPAGVTNFVQRRPVPVDRLEIGVWRRHLHIVECRNVVSAIAADAEVDSGRCDERFDLWFDQAGGRWRSFDRDGLRQTLALRGIEDSEPLEERDRVGVVAGFASAPFLVVWDEAVGIDDGGAALALPDIAAKRERLAEGKPALVRKPCCMTAPQRIRTLMPE